MPRRAARVDTNHGQIVQWFEHCGCVVQSLAALGDGVADLLVFHRSTRRLLIVECKDGSRKPSERRLTPDQVAWHTAWLGAPVYVVERAEDVPGLLSGVPAVLERCESGRVLERMKGRAE